MTFSEYQEAARTTAVYPNLGKNFIYPTLGLAGEAGEVANKVKKIIRENDGVVTPESRDMIIKELGDVLWYAAQLATELQVDFEDVAAKNIEKLRSRQQRNQLQGSGDER